MTVYFTSDLHLGHKDILAFATRPWKSIAEHDEALIERINDVVGDRDELFILGDFTLSADDRRVREWLSRIVCKNRYLVIGNHDKAASLFEPGSFKECCHYKEVEVAGRLCCLSHYPMLDWNLSTLHHGVDPSVASLMLHGHVHSCTRGSNGDNARAGIWRYDVGIDANGYRPVSFEEIRDFIAERDSRLAN